MLRASSPGLRCFRHPQHFSHTRWLTLVAAVADSPTSTDTKTLPDHLRCKPHREYWNNTAGEEGAGVTAKLSTPPKGGMDGVEKVQSEAWKHAQGNRKPPPVVPLKTTVEPFVRLYFSCHCRKQRANSLLKPIPPQNQAMVSGPDQVELAHTPIHDVHHRDITTGLAGPIFVKLFGYESRLSLYERRVRHKCLRVMATTTSLEEVWTAYREVTLLGPTMFIPWQFLHRVVRLIAATRPRIRPHFECLLEILAKIHESGGKVETWEWGVLIDAAGKGLRKTTESQFRNVLSIYDDFLCKRSPGASIRSEARGMAKRIKRKPDEVMLTIVLHMASRTKNNRAFEHAVSLVHASGVQSSRKIYLTLMDRHSMLGNLDALRAVVLDMKRRNIELGIEGLTSYMWAHARLGHVKVAERIFTVLKANAAGQWTQQINADRLYLQSIQLDIPPDTFPDYVTYTAMVQIYAYQGHFKLCLGTLVDMFKALRPPSDSETRGVIPVDTLLPAYRAIFLGFYHHSQLNLSTNSALVRHSQSIIRGSAGWTLPACQTVFNDWLRLPHKVRPNNNMIFWILRSFETLSGGDAELLQGVIGQLENRFGSQWNRRAKRWTKPDRTDESHGGQPPFTDH